MKAIQKTSGLAHRILHPDVIEIPSDRPKYRKFKCTRCGIEWLDVTNAPVIINDEINIKDYYPNYSLC